MAQGDSKPVGRTFGVAVMVKEEMTLWRIQEA
jgi:hypothetical protein